MPADTSGALDFWASFLTGPGGLVGAEKSDGSYAYYQEQSRMIQDALNSPDVAPERKQQLRQQQAQLDQQFYPQRVEAATTKLQQAPTDAEALAALQELESLQNSVGAGSPGSGPTAQSPKYDNGRPTYDPTNEAQLRAEFERNGGEAGSGYSFEEYKRTVARENPNGELRYTGTSVQSNGEPATYPGYNNLGAQLEGIDRQVLSNAQLQRAGQLGYYDNITGRALGDLETKNKQTDATSQQILQNLAASGASTKASTTAYVGQLDAAARAANQRSNASLDRYTGAVDQYNASNLSALDAYKTGIAPYQTEIAGTTYNAIAPDAEGLGYQRQALGMGSSIYGGSLDYTSQAAQAYADPADVARTLQGLAMLQDQAISGGDEQRLNLDHARAQLASGGDEQRNILDLALNELETGGDKQRDVYKRYDEISRPEMTAAERAILAQSQRQYATQDKANRDALTSNLEARGVLSGAGLIAGQQASQQRLGEERVAGTLGAQAQAVQRALYGLQGMESSANALRSGDQQALGLASDAATRLRTGEQNALQLEQAAANALRAGDLAAAQAYTQAAQVQRAQGFQEEYSRGVAADNASANNQATRLGGAQIYANQANQIRLANDDINKFNANQQGITDRYNTTFKQSEYDRLAGLQQSTLNNTVGINQTNLGNESQLNTATQGAIGDQFGRTNTAIQTGIGTSFGNYGIDMGYAGTALGENQASQQRQQTLSNAKIDNATRRIDLSTSTNQDVQDALRKLQGSKVDIYGLNSVG